MKEQQQAFLDAGQPIISVDTKKKELIGNFANRGQIWAKEPVRVNAHDFRSDAECIAAPYGVYDPKRNTGFVFVGTSSDTPEFSVDAICEWWRRNHRHYPGARKLLILADSGGSNGCRPRLFKAMLQQRLADHFGITVTICHYPTGASKWNPVEHRLFGPISNNWAGVPLTSLKLMVRLIRETRNSSGLRVQATTTQRGYKTKQRVSNQVMKTLRILHHQACPQWNYTISPRCQN
jgi:hypothetical protein